MSFFCKGKILISPPGTSGDIFSRSVVLIVMHNEQGALGFILNKKSKEMSKNLLSILHQKVDIYDGGPVCRDKMFFILKGKKLVSNYYSIGKEYYLTEDTEAVISAILDEKIQLEQVKIFLGYSGWSSQQLDNEIKNKMWTVVQMHNLNYVSSDDHNLWKDIMQNLGGEYLLWANAPEDIQMN